MGYGLRIGAFVTLPFRFFLTATAPLSSDLRNQPLAETDHSCAVMLCQNREPTVDFN
jgi:hypothetical protein